MTETSFEGIRVFLLDDHPTVREGLALLLGHYGVTVCGEASCREEALRLLADSSADLLLLDLSLGEESGLDVIEELQAAGIKTLVYTMHDDFHHIRAALKAGVQGYVIKREMTATLKDAIRAVISGRQYLSPATSASLQSGGFEPDEQVVIERFSPRELEIFLKTGEGLSARDISEELLISISTIETYYSRIIAKLECSGVKEMRRRAILYCNTHPKKLIESLVR
jgi:DNA-binding NarL/FixJ family response regulator